jgi:hypothetical protein
VICGKKIEAVYSEPELSIYIAKNAQQLGSATQMSVGNFHPENVPGLMAVLSQARGLHEAFLRKKGRDLGLQQDFTGHTFIQDEAQKPTNARHVAE